MYCLIYFEAHSHRAKEAKAKILFGVFRLFYYLFRMLFDLFRFCYHFCLVWIGPKLAHFISTNINDMIN